MVTGKVYWYPLKEAGLCYVEKVKGIVVNSD
jgi:hypothetical protein